MPSQNAGNPSPAVVNRRINRSARRPRWRAAIAAEYQPQRRFQPRGNQLQGIHPVYNRLPQLALQQVAQKIAVLNPQRFIEGKLRANAGQRRRRAAHPQQNTRRIAGDRAHHHEGDQADTQQNRQQL